MATIRLPNNWVPRKYQEPAWQYLEAGGKHAELCWHRRSGKDDLCLHWAAVSSFQRAGNLWHMLPKANQARKALWEAVNPHTGKRRVDEAFPKEIRSGYNDHEMLLKLKSGSTWQVVGSDNFDSLVGSPPVGIVFSEWPLSDPSSWAYLRPIMAENKGWAIFNGTPRGKNHAYRTFRAAQKEPGHFAQRLTAKETGVFTPEQLAAERRQLIADYGPDYGQSLYDQEYDCSFEAANLGAILGRWLTRAQVQGRICEGVFDPDGAPIEISSDIGFRDTATWWFWQPRADGFGIVDFDAGSGLEADEWIDRLQERVKSAGYKLGRIWLPKDAKAKTFATKHSAVERFLSKFGSEVVRIVPASKVIDRINAGRRVIEKCWFELDTTEEGREGLSAWKYVYDEERKEFSKEPDHDWACFTPDTPIRTVSGDKRIDELLVGDLVSTPAGARRILAVHRYHARKLVEVTLADGRILICTTNHKFFTTAGLVHADGLHYDSVLFSGEELLWQWISWISWAAGFTGIHQAISALTRPGSSVERGNRHSNSIAYTGSTFADRFQRVMRSITVTVTKAITSYRTWNASRWVSIRGCMGLRLAGVRPNGTAPQMERNSTPTTSRNAGSATEENYSRHLSLLSPSAERPQRSGTQAIRVQHGTQSTVSGYGKKESNLKRLALYAVSLFLRIGRTGGSSAMRIVALRTFDADTQVYDLTIEQHHCYIANGVLSSNSHFGDGFTYGAQVMSERLPELKEEKKPLRGQVIVMPNGGFSFAKSLEEMWAETPKASARI